MAIELNNTFLERLLTGYQTSTGTYTFRRPLVNISTIPIETSIPIIGRRIDEDYVNPPSQTEPVDGTDPNVIILSDGRLALIYIGGGPTSGEMSYLYSDVDRTYFTKVFETFDVGAEPDDASICELTDGNVGLVGLGYFDGDDSWALNKKIITPEGVVVYGYPVTAYSTHVIETWTADEGTSTGPYVITLANGTYLLTYTRYVSNEWHLYTRTSSDFITWSAATTLHLSGSAITHDNKIFDPYLCQLSNGDIWLLFSYVESIGGSGEELSNIWYTSSSNNGSTWGEPVQLTTYTGYSSYATHPVLVQKSSSLSTLIYTLSSGAFHMSDTSTGWEGTGTYDSNRIGAMHFDPVERMLYATSVWSGIGAKNLDCVVKIDVDTWTIDNCWNTETSSPHFPEYYGTHHCWYDNTHSERNKIVVVCYELNSVSVLDGITDTIVTYNFETNLEHSVVQNVNWVPQGTRQWMEVTRAWIDFDNDLMYVMIVQTAGGRTIQIGTINLLDAGPEYNFTDLFSETSVVTEAQMMGIKAAGNGGWLVDPVNDLLFLSYTNDIGGSFGDGTLRVHILSNGAIYRTYNHTDNSWFPKWGLYFGSGVVYDNEILYSGFKYSSTYGDGALRGLCCINIANSSATYAVPTFDSMDDYLLTGLSLTEDHNILMGLWGAESTVLQYSPSTSTWLHWDNENVPGLTASSLAYNAVVTSSDSVTDLMFTGWSYGTFTGGGAMITAHLAYGTARQSYYSEGTGTPPSSWTTTTPLVSGVLAYDAVAVLRPNTTSLYVFWEQVSSVYVDNVGIAWYTTVIYFGEDDSVTVDLSAFLVRGEEIIRETSLNDPGSLSFTISHGHLFDPFNVSSLYSDILKKGRPLSLRFGEHVPLSDTEYWVDQGKFIVTQVSMEYRKLSYPILHVQAQDIRVLWGLSNITATPYYTDQTPIYILEDIITRYTNYEVADLAFPATFDDQSNLNFQWVDSTVLDMLTQICHRFGYVLKMNVDGTITAIKIAVDNTMSTVYENANTILAYTPDDSFSDFTNKVVITGEDDIDIEITYAEENVGSLSGTCGWWGFEKNFRVWYSDDHTKRCRNPRLVVKESGYSGMIGKLVTESDGVTETLLDNSSSDANEYNREKYCTIVVEAEDLTPWVGVAALLLIGTSMVPDF